ncbi:hypothetical protein PANT_22c00017 [Moesziomyces antarcticus T-34]|uniref:Endonuclease/exonuclease/phosphatase domain-containing protein n=1 Tax=Pseudozyma antarctica (strain T-34) TaxID=1151754 RepID=M9MFR0_PSEA3|nr:hypothetical protein PANT_22c00017 [Moesziomyces antarcticus T-34]
MSTSSSSVPFSVARSGNAALSVGGPGFKIASWNAFNIKSRMVDLKDPTNDALRTADILCLQECRAVPKGGGHISGSKAAQWIAPFWTSGTNAVLTHDCGVVCRLPHEAMDILFAGDRALLVRIQLKADLLDGVASKTLYVWSIHGASNNSQGWFSQKNLPFHLFYPDRWVNQDPPLVLVGADWNAFPKRFADTAGVSYMNTKWNPIADLIDPVGLVDCYRHVHPAGSSFSRVNRRLGRYSARRIDLVHVSTSLAPYLTEAEHVSTTSDHRAVLVTVGRPEESRTPDQPLSHDEAFYKDVQVRSYLWAWESSRSPPFASSSSSLPSPSPSLDTSDAEMSSPPFIAPSTPLDLLPDFFAWQSVKQEVLARVMEVQEQVRTEQSRRRQTPRERTLDDASADPQHRHTMEARLRRQIFATTAESKSKWPEDSAPFVPVGSKGIERGMDITAHLAGRHMTMDPVDLEVAEDSIFPASPRNLSDPGARVLKESFNEVEMLSNLASIPQRPGPDGLHPGVVPLVAEVAVPFLVALLNRLGHDLKLPEGQPHILGEPYRQEAAEEHDLDAFRLLLTPNWDYGLLTSTLAERFWDACEVDEIFSPWNLKACRSREAEGILAVFQGWLDLAALSRSPIRVVVVGIEDLYEQLERDFVIRLLIWYGFPASTILAVKALLCSATLVVQIGDDSSLRQDLPMERGLVRGDQLSEVLAALVVQIFMDVLNVCRGPSKLPLLALDSHVLVCLPDEKKNEDAIDVALRFFSRATGVDFLSGKEIFVPETSAEEQDQDLPSADAHESAYSAESEDTYVDEGDSDLDDLADGENLANTDEQCEFRHRAYTISVGERVPRRLLPCLISRVESYFASFGYANLGTKVEGANWITTTVCSQLSFNALVSHFADELRRLIRNFLSGPQTIAWTTLTTAKARGGFGVLDPQTLLLSHCGALVARLATSRHTEHGKLFRQGFGKNLVQVHKASSTALLLRGQDSNPLPGTFLNKRIERLSWHHGSFWDRCLHTLARLHVSFVPDWESYSLEEILALPWRSPALYGCDLEGLTETMYRDCMAAGLWSWADVIWYNERRPGRSRKLDFSSLPICPVLTKGLELHWKGRINRLDWDDPSSTRRTQVANGTSVFRSRWDDYWKALPEGLRSKLKTIPDHYGVEKDLAKATDSQSSHTRPFVWEPALFELPWRHLTIASTPLAEADFQTILDWLESGTVIVPSWPFIPAGQQRSSKMANRRQSRHGHDITMDEMDLRWCFVWREAHQERLPGPVQDHLQLFLLHRPRRAILFGAGAPPRPDRDWQTRGTFSTVATSATGGEADDDADDDIYDAQGTDSALPAGSSNPCPEGCCSRDTPSHGFWECPLAQDVWKEAVVVLRGFCPELVEHIDLARTTIQNVVYGWTSIPAAKPRHRLLVWRAAVVSFLSHFREVAITNNLRSRQPVRFKHRERHPQAWITTRIQQTIKLNWKSVSPHSDAEVQAFEESWLLDADPVFGAIRYTDAAVAYLFVPDSQAAAQTSASASESKVPKVAGGSAKASSQRASPGPNAPLEPWTLDRRGLIRVDPPQAKAIGGLLQDKGKRRARSEDEDESDSADDGSVRCLRHKGKRRAVILDEDEDEDEDACVVGEDEKDPFGLPFPEQEPDASMVIQDSEDELDVGPADNHLVPQSDSDSDVVFCGVKAASPPARAPTPVRQPGPSRARTIAPMAAAPPSRSSGRQKRSLAKAAQAPGQTKLDRFFGSR